MFLIQFLEVIWSMPKNFAFFQRLLDKFFYKFDNPEINRQQIFPASFKWHCFQVSYARAQLAKDINLHQKEVSITFRRNIRNMLIIGLSSQIAVRAETVNVTAHRVITSQKLSQRVALMLYNVSLISLPVISISRRFNRGSFLMQILSFC